ncbi:hypothetical protein CLOM_g7078 [Closterium sp. NIES-68]|nr:hypothetical protein CLOM_g7078 [Closterium sp. NIES-68]
MGFHVKGIISDDGGSFKAAIVGRDITHQMDVWHKGRALTRKFVKELVDALSPVLSVSDAESCADLWLLGRKELWGWLEKQKEIRGTVSATSLKTTMVRAVCATMGKFAFDAAAKPPTRFLYEEMRKVQCVARRMVGEAPPRRKRCRKDTDAQGVK